MRYIEFTEKEKAAWFDQIAKNFYTANFGLSSKAEIELLMFHIYLEKLIDANKSADGTIDYTKCSDYLIAKELGITQQRVRNLKVKKQLVYPIEFDWKCALAPLTKNARYEEESRKITISIPDPNLFYELQNFIEESGGYIEIQLNAKVMQIRAEYYMALLVSMEEAANQKKIIKNLKDQFKNNNKMNRSFDEKNIGRSLLRIGLNTTEFAANISTIISSGSSIAPLWNAFSALISNADS